MKKLIITAAVLFLPAIGAYAQSPSFYQLDADENSFISKSEAQANIDLVEAFDVLDLDLDGQLTLEEYQALVQQGS